MILMNQYYYQVVKKAAYTNVMKVRQEIQGEFAESLKEMITVLQDKNSILILKPVLVKTPDKEDNVQQHVKVIQWLENY